MDVLRTPLRRATFRNPLLGMNTPLHLFAGGVVFTLRNRLHHTHMETGRSRGRGGPSSQGPKERGVDAALRALGEEAWRKKDLERSNVTLRRWLVLVLPWVVLGCSLLGLFIFHTVQFVEGRNNPDWRVDASASNTLPMPSMLLCAASNQTFVDSYVGVRSLNATRYHFPGGLRWERTEGGGLGTGYCALVDATSVYPHLWLSPSSAPAGQEAAALSWASVVYFPQATDTAISAALLYPASPSQVAQCRSQPQQYTHGASPVSCLITNLLSSVTLSVSAGEYLQVGLAPSLYEPLASPSYWAMGTYMTSEKFNPVVSGGRPVPPGFEAWTVSWGLRSSTYLVYQERYPVSLSSLFVDYFVSFSVSATAFSLSRGVLSRLFYRVAQRRALKRCRPQESLYQELLPVACGEEEEREGEHELVARAKGE